MRIWRFGYMMSTRQRCIMACATVLTALPCACSTDYNLATWRCKASTSRGNDAGSAEASSAFEVPWSTSFENGFCDYDEGSGFCYTTGTASYKVVTTPVHLGQYAAAYTVRSGGDGDSYNSRCVRQGALPERAYFQAWYFVPVAAVNTGTWNLWHFKGDTDDDLRGFLDISLQNSTGGGLRLETYTFGKSSLPDQSAAPPIPIGTWFRIGLLLERSAGTGGEISVFQDGAMILHQADVHTDDSTSAQWYVGNWATDLDPAESTLYVDDVLVGSDM